MPPDTLADRIIDQFSYRGKHAEIWRGFDLFIDTDEFLNLGYSKWYQPLIAGSSQRRLVAKIGNSLDRRLPATTGISLVDIGCGRGGPAIHLATTHGFDVIGIDLVPYNIAAARKNASRTDPSVGFIVADALRLPFDDQSFPVCTAFDSIVYMPRKPAVFEELARVVTDDGLIAISDLVSQNGLGSPQRAAIDEFAAAWDMPPIPSVDQYQRYLEDAEFEIEIVEDISANSTARFRKWTRLYLGLADHLDSGVDRLLDYWHLDAETITEQIRLAHAALPSLRHIIVYARPDP